VVDTPEGQKRCSLLSKSVAEKQRIITFHIAERAVYGIAQTRKGLSPKLQEVLEEYEDRFNGVGTLKDKRGKIKCVKIQVDAAVRPVAQSYRLPPIHLEDKFIK
jgi:hypothetical protein